MYIAFIRQDTCSEKGILFLFKLWVYNLNPRRYKYDTFDCVNTFKNNYHGGIQRKYDAFLLLILF